MIINEKSQTELSSFYVVFKGSVLNENTKTYGVSHILEHLVCKMFTHLYDDFDRYSISWNAYTSNDCIVYYISGLDEYVNKYKYEFLNSLLKFDVPKDEFETEKKVVIQEYKDVFQDQSDTLTSNILRMTYGNYGAIGKLESLKKIKHNDVIEYWNKYLSKPTTIINISKHNDFVGDYEFNEEYPKYYKVDETDTLKLETKMKFSKSGVAGYIKVNDDFHYISYVLSMLSMSILSPFSNEIREKRGLTYSVSSYVDRISDNEGLVITELITTDESTQEVLDIFKMILTDRDKYLTRERFDIIKDYLTVRTKKQEIERYKHVSKFINPKNWQLSEILDDITFEKTQEIFDKYLSYDKWTWIVDKKNIK